MLGGKVSAIELAAGQAVRRKNIDPTYPSDTVSPGLGQDKTALSSVYRPDIDGLRAIAILSVMLYHFGAGFAKGGFVGVDIFLVISGYVITNSLVRDIGEGEFSLLSFYARRVRRIIPALFFVTLCTALVGTWLLMPDDLVGMFRAIRALSVFSSNIFFWKSISYFDRASAISPFLHTWSLSVEEQFYIFWPVIVVALARYGQRTMNVAFAMIAVASVAAAFVLAFSSPISGFYLLPARVWEFTIGGFLAINRFESPRSRVVRDALALAGLVLIGFTVVTLSDFEPFPAWNALAPCVGAALLIYSGSHLPQRSSIGTRLLGTRFMVGIGLISYSLYLVHWPIVVFARYGLVMRNADWAIGALVVLSIAIAWLMWRFIEQPFRHARSSRRHVLGAGIAIIGAMFALGQVGISTAGLPKRFAEPTDVRIPGEESWRVGTCFLEPTSAPQTWDAAACSRIHGSGGNILLWGDSFAAQYVPGIVHEEKRINSNVIQYTRGGCAPILTGIMRTDRACAQFNRRVIELIKQKDIDTVVISARWSSYPDRYILSLRPTIGRLAALGVHVFVLGQSPEFEADVRRLDYLSDNWRNREAARWPVSFASDLNRKVRESSAGSTFIDPTQALCNARTCIYRRGTTYYFLDDGHFSTAGSVVAVKAFFPSAVGRK